MSYKKFVFLGLSIVFLSIVFSSSKVSADGGGFRLGKNSQERATIKECSNATSRESFASTWFVDPSKTGGDGYYYTDSFNIAYDAKEVTLAIKGSILQCYNRSKVLNYGLVNNISMANEWIGFPKNGTYEGVSYQNQQRFKDTSGFVNFDNIALSSNKRIDFGGMPNVGQRFSPNGGSQYQVFSEKTGSNVTVKFNVEGIARNGGSESVTVAVYQCPWVRYNATGQVYDSGGVQWPIRDTGQSVLCGINPVTIKFYRAYPPSKIDLDVEVTDGSRSSANMNFSTRSKEIEVTPGQTVKWWFYGRNMSEFKNTVGNLYFLGKRRIEAGTGAKIDGKEWVESWYKTSSYELLSWRLNSSKAGGGENPISLAYNEPVNASTAKGRRFVQSIKVTDADVGRRFCARTVVFDNPSYNNEMNGTGWACARVVAKYDLIPNVNLNADTVNSTEKQLLDKINMSIKNSGPSVSNSETQYRVSYGVVKKGVSIPSDKNGVVWEDNDYICSSNRSWLSDCGVVLGASSGGDQDGYFKGPIKTGITDADSGRKFYTVGNILNTGNGTPTEVTPSLSIGDRVCIILSVNRYSTDNQLIGISWRSHMDCVTIAKQPTLQVWGGDASVNSTNLSAFKVNGKSYGSWLEYALYVNKGDVRNNIVSAGKSLNGGSDSDRNVLVYANTGTGTSYWGKFNPNPTTSSYSELNRISKPNMVGTTTANPNTSGKFNDVKLSGGTIDGERYIESTGTVTITGNITSNTSSVEFSKLPQLIIKAKNVVIDKSVTRVDAWIIASETIKTCNSDNASQCNNKLVINGAVQAGKNIEWKRTWGAIDDSSTGEKANDAAEVVNLSGSTYVWGLSRAEGRGAWETTYIKELPPRF